MGEWSDWQKEKIEKDDLTNVEEKVEKEEDGKEVVTRNNNYSIEATYNETVGCPAGYTESSGACRSMTQGETINATPSYSCPQGYELQGTKCKGSINTINAAVRHSCPASNNDIIFELSGDKCKTYYIKYTGKQTNTYYTCPNGYSLSGDRCYAYQTYEEEITKYKDVTYYRYQKREQKESKIETIWSTKDNQELLKLYLEKENYEAIIANNGEEALRLFEFENPDLILLDVMMPKLDGWQVCREVRKHSECPIIMITAKGETA